MLQAFLHTGVETFWPMSIRTVGGFPAKIRFKLFKIPSPAESVDLAVYVDHLQHIMQLELDLLNLIDTHANKEEIEAVRAVLHDEIHRISNGDQSVENEIEKGMMMEKSVPTKI